MPRRADTSSAGAAGAGAAAGAAAGDADAQRGGALYRDGDRTRGIPPCQGCHGVTGYKNAYPSYHVPKIGGQSAEYLAQALTEYQKGGRKHPTMQAQSQSFSDQDIADLSAYLSSLK